MPYLVCNVCHARNLVTVTALKYMNGSDYYCSAACFGAAIKNVSPRNPPYPYKPYRRPNGPSGEVWSHVFNQFFASSYEEDVAKFLSKLDIRFTYEPFSFPVGSTIIVPDFYIPSLDLFLEVKGLWRGSSKKKFKQLVTEHNVVRVMLVPYSLRGSIVKFNKHKELK